MSHPASESRITASKRTVIIGDVHGCIVELRKLLKLAEVGPTDDIICVGDLVRKGPDCAAVLRWAMETPNLRCVLGNHDARLLFRWFEGQKPDRGSVDWELHRDLGDSYNDAMEFIRSWPLYIEAAGCLVVHAGLDPRISSVRLQSPSDLMTIRVPEGMKIPWYEAYTSDQLVVFGHWARNEPVIRPNAIGLDTGCVYGGSLTALILPERRLISVPAEKAYQSKD
jgi:diadenosine tetraphosphatase ApaH/serine/threonine PP2A family protein phosphatase